MGKLTLLIADDVEMNRSVIRRLMGKDYEVLEAENGIEVLNVLESNHVDVIILDIIMPEMDGLEALKKIRQRPEWDAIGVLVSTSKKEQTERMALSAGADDVVSKPYDPIIIKQRIRNILAKKEMDRIRMRGIKGFTKEEWCEAEDKLYSIKNKCELAIRDQENGGLSLELFSRIEEEVDFLIHILVTREGNSL